MSRAVMEKVATMSEHMGKVSQRRRLQEETMAIKINLTEMKNLFNGLIGRIKSWRISAVGIISTETCQPKNQRKTLM